MGTDARPPAHARPFILAKHSARRPIRRSRGNPHAPTPHPTRRTQGPRPAPRWHHPGTGCARKQAPLAPSRSARRARPRSRRAKPAPMARARPRACPQGATEGKEVPLTSPRGDIMSETITTTTACVLSSMNFGNYHLFLSGVPTELFRVLPRGHGPTRLRFLAVA